MHASLSSPSLLVVIEPVIALNSERIIQNGDTWEDVNLYRFSLLLERLNVPYA
jgi:hypothetical protein